MQNEIKASDLRIGNWVECILSDKKVKIEGISKSDHSFGAYYIEFDNGSKTVIKDFDNDYYIKSIPLTPEILEKAGFEAAEIDKGIEKEIGYYNNGLMVLNSNNIYYAAPYGYPMRGACIYLHQLQNLFFCLCGKELEVHI